MLMKMKHKKGFLRGLILIGICLLFVGCSQTPDSTSKESIPNEGASVNQILDLRGYFDYNLNETLFYNGIADYSRYETCVKIDEVISPEAGKLYYFEGEVEDLSGGELGDLSFYKAYKVTKDSLSEYYSDQREMVLLKSEVSEGTTWETEMIDAQLGMIRVQAKVIKIAEDSVSVEYTFLPNQVFPASKQYTLVYEFKLGQGIVKENKIFSEYEFGTLLTRKSSEAPVEFVSRYIKPDEMVAKIYSNAYMADRLSDAIFKEKNRLPNQTDDTLLKVYKTYLEGLKPEKISSISRGKEMLDFFVEMSQSPLELVSAYIEFYEVECYEESYDWTEQIRLYDSAQFDALYSYDDVLNKFAVNKNLVGTNRAIGELLIKNGLDIDYVEGYPYMAPSSAYLNRIIKLDDDLVKPYIELKTFQYDFFPIQSDAYLMVSAEELSEAIHVFDAHYLEHSTYEAFDEAKYLADYLFELYILPNDYFSEDYNYKGAYITEYYLKSYQEYIKAYPESTYTPILSNIVKLLNENAMAYSKPLDQYLNTLNYRPNSETFRLRFKQIDEFENLTKGKQRILLNPSASQVLTVSNINDLLKAIGSNKTIYLKPGNYQIPYSLEIENENVAIDEGTLRIKNVENLTLLTEQGIADLIADSYFEVLVLDHSSNIQMDGIRLGHLREYCVGDVIAVKASKNIELNRLILFGCGYNGLNLDQVNGLSISNTLISDCQSNGLVFSNSSNVSVLNTQFYRNGKQLFDFVNTKGIVLRDVIARDNDKIAYDTSNALMRVDKASDVTIDNSELDTTYVDLMIEGDGRVIQ